MEGIDAVKKLVALCDNMAMETMRIEGIFRGPVDDWPSRDDMIALMAGMRGMSQDTATLLRQIVHGMERAV